MRKKMHETVVTMHASCPLIKVGKVVCRRLPVWAGKSTPAEARIRAFGNKIRHGIEQHTKYHDGSIGGQKYLGVHILTAHRE